MALLRTSLCVAALFECVSPALAASPQTCSDAACVDEEASLLQQRQGQVSMVSMSDNKTSCRGAGNNCNVGSCCSGLYCVGKGKNNGNYCMPPPQQLDPLPPGDIPPGGMQFWITQQLLTYLNLEIIPPLVVKGLNEANAAAQSVEVRKKAADLWGGLQIRNLEIAPITVGQVKLAFQSGLGIRVTFLDVFVKATMQIYERALVIPGWTSVSVATKQNSGFSALLQFSSTSGLLEFSVPPDYIVSTFAITVHQKTLMMVPFLGFLNIVTDVIIDSIIPGITRKLNDALAAMGASFGKDQSNVLFISTIPPLLVSGYVMGVNTFSDQILFTVSGAPVVATAVDCGALAGTALIAAEEETTTSSGASLLAGGLGCRKEGHLCNVGSCCGSLICTPKRNGGMHCTQPMTTHAPTAAPSRTTAMPPCGLQPFPTAMPAPWASTAPASGMLGLRVNQYVANGQFWFLQELGFFSETRAFPKAGVVLDAAALHACTVSKCDVTTASVTAPVLEFAGGKAVLSVEVTMKVFKVSEPSTILKTWYGNATVSATASIQQPASGAQLLTVSVDLESLKTNLDLPGKIVEILEHALVKFTSTTVTLPAALASTQLSAASEWIQLTTNIAL